MGDFFTDDLLASLNDKPALEAMEEALLESRKVGFDYVDDEEALTHFGAEVDEAKAAFKNESPAAALDELADVQFLLGELARRRGGRLADASRLNTRKFLRRLNFIEKRLKEEGKTWADVSWPDDIKPMWADAKKAGL